MNNERKEKIRPDMGIAKHLAFRNNKVTHELFGDGIESEFKKTETSNKLTEAMRGKPFKRQHHFDNNRKGNFKKPKMDTDYFKRKTQDFFGGGRRKFKPPQERKQTWKHQQQNNVRKNNGRGRKNY